MLLRIPLPLNLSSFLRLIKSLPQKIISFIHLVCQIILFNYFKNYSLTIILFKMIKSNDFSLTMFSFRSPHDYVSSWMRSATPKIFKGPFGRCLCPVAARMPTIPSERRIVLVNINRSNRNNRNSCRPRLRSGQSLRCFLLNPSWIWLVKGDTYIHRHINTYIYILQDTYIYRYTNL